MRSSDPGRQLYADGFQVSRALIYLGGFGAYGLALSALHATTGIGLPCPFRAVTGWECPLCGGTRLGAALLRGDLAAAFAFNPLVLVGLAVLSALGVLWMVELLGGPRVRPPSWLATRLRRVRPTSWLIGGLVVSVLYTVLRNLV
jgi:hypothetical protein